MIGKEHIMTLATAATITCAPAKPCKCEQPNSLHLDQHNLLFAAYASAGRGWRTGGHAGAAQLLPLGAAAMVEDDGDAGAPALKLSHPV